MDDPQSVTDLMAETRAQWARECDACEGAACDARRELYDRLCALADEYPLADYPRREDIEKELRGLMVRHCALPPIEVSDQAEVPEDEVVLGAEAAGAAEPLRARPPLYAEPDPLAASGPEGEAAAEGPVPPREDSGAGRDREQAGAHRSPRFDAGADARGDFGPEPSRGAEQGGVAERVGHWLRRAYDEMDYQALIRKREGRLAELGGRVQELAAEGRLADAATDEGVRVMLAQVAQVDEAMAEHRARAGG